MAVSQFRFGRAELRWLDETARLIGPSHAGRMPALWHSAGIINTSLISLPGNFQPFSTQQTGTSDHLFSSQALNLYPKQMAGTCPPCPECDDSLLSSIANYLGILTFALGLFLSTFAFLVTVRSADKEVDALIGSLESTGRYIEQTKAFFQAMNYEADLDLTGMGILPSSATRSIEDTHSRILGSLRETKLHISQLPTRVEWWYRAKDVQADMSKLDSERQHLHSVQLTLLLM